MKKIAIFASGSGSNAENIAGYFAAGNTARVELILTNRPDAKVLRRAEKLQIESVVFDRDTFYNSDRIVVLMRRRQIDYVVLAGFLWLVPENLLTAYPNRIVNIHPALLPRHGGKGMYGDRVHRAVVEAGDRETGITIHRVNEALRQRRHPGSVPRAGNRNRYAGDGSGQSPRAGIRALSGRNRKRSPDCKGVS